MLDLKPYFDAVIAADADVQRVAAEIDALFRSGTEETMQQAIALRPALDQAQNKHAEAVTLYEAMQKANRPNDAAKNFVPVSSTQAEAVGQQQPSTIKRQEYDRLSLVERERFIKSGGTVSD